MYKKYLEEVYDEAVKAVYPETEKRTKCIEEIVPLIRQGLKVLDFCSGEGELKRFCPWIEEFKGGEFYKLSPSRKGSQYEGSIHRRRGYGRGNAVSHSGERGEHTKGYLC